MVSSSAYDFNAYPPTDGNTFSRVLRGHGLTWFVLSLLPRGLPNGRVICRFTGVLCSLDKTASLSNAPGLARDGLHKITAIRKTPRTKRFFILGRFLAKPRYWPSALH